MQKTIGIYQSHLNKIGGVETFLYNFCYNLRNYYDITVIYSSADKSQLNRLSSLVKTQKYNSQPIFEFDIVIRNSVWGEIPDKMISKDNIYIEMRHADYEYISIKGSFLNTVYKKWDKINKVVACGDFVAAQSNKVMGDKATSIKNILLPKKKINKILHFVTFSRLDNEKGWGRMLQMCSMLKQAKIKFTWDIYTNDKKISPYEELRFHNTIIDNNRFDYMADADYCVLLSDAEGLPYTVQESLQYDTPCIVTNIGGCTELIADGVNGYVVPLDMNFDINKLLNIPKISNYNNGALEKWKEYLGNAEYKEQEKICIGYLVEATEEYQKLPLRDIELNRIPEKGEQWIVPVDRAFMLAGDNKYKKNFVILKERIYEDD